MNFNFGCDITEQYLIKIYDDLQQEQLRLMNNIKNNSEDEPKRNSSVTKQISYINAINMNIIKLRNVRKKNIDV